MSLGLTSETSRMCVCETRREIRAWWLARSSAIKGNEAASCIPSSLPSFQVPRYDVESGIQPGLTYLSCCTIPPSSPNPNCRASHTQYTSNPPHHLRSLDGGHDAALPPGLSVTHTDRTSFFHCPCTLRSQGTDVIHRQNNYLPYCIGRQVRNLILSNLLVGGTLAQQIIRSLSQRTDSHIITKLRHDQRPKNQGNRRRVSHETLNTTAS
ncbi:hypothetical protein VTK56DRAFT_9315 [Thermocarpiscus australiensis]